MSHLIRRTLLLIALSAGGIALLAPLAARSAAPEPPVVDAWLLPAAEAPAAVLDRGGVLTGRSTELDRATVSGGTESLEAPVEATPGVAPMEATLQDIATPKPAPVVAAAPAAPPAPSEPFVLDGSVWDRLAQCESGGNWSINTGNGYYGGLQFSYGTWHAYGGGEFAEYPHQATREEQIIVAERLHAARGFQPWPACRVKLGLP